MTLKLRRWIAVRILWALGIRTWSDARAVVGAPAVRPPSSSEWDSFERAFDARVCGCRAACRCGRVFWDNYNSGYDWYEDELKALISNPLATPVAYAVGYVEFEGSSYVLDCDCWRDRALRIRGFLDGHAEQIAEYLSLEKRRLEVAAARAPEVRS